MDNLHHITVDLLDTYKDHRIARKFLQVIASCKKPLALMEVCGTHTVAVFRSGIKSGLPDNINLVSGPGCPVCVTPAKVIEQAKGIASKGDTVLFCFGDMMRVPGVMETLETAQSRSNVHTKIMYSPLDALEYAKQVPDKTIVLLGTGFETTVPLFASILARAQKEHIMNLYLLSHFRLIPPAIDALLLEGEIAIDGFMLPGHVSTIIGVDAYRFMVEKYRVPGVIAGFDVVDILSGIASLVDMNDKGIIEIKNQYPRFVNTHGNTKAQETIYKVFRKTDAVWRGLGIIPKSGLVLSDSFSSFDAEHLIDFEIEEATEPQGCRCGDVIKGVCKPPDCPLYGVRCTPSYPVGPCMVSSEGTCAAYNKYGG